MEQVEIFKCDQCSDTDPHVHTNFTAMWRQQAEFAKQHQERASPFEWPEVRVDPAMPPGEIHFVQRGVVVGKIVGIAPAKWPGADIHLL